MLDLATWLVFLADGLGWELKVFGMADDVKAEDALGFVLQSQYSLKFSNCDCKTNIHVHDVFDTCWQDTNAGCLALHSN